MESEQHIEEFEIHEGKKIPIIYVTRDKRTGFCKFWCKYCQTYHNHGRGDGHRVAHCGCDKASPYHETGYILKTQEGFQGNIYNIHYTLNWFDLSTGDKTVRHICKDSTFEDLKQSESIIDAYEVGNYSEVTRLALIWMGLLKDGDIIVDYQSEGNGMPDFEVRVKDTTKVAGPVKIVWDAEFRGYQPPANKPYQVDSFYVEFKSHKDALRMNQLYSFSRILRHEGRKVYILHIEKTEVRGGHGS